MGVRAIMLISTSILAACASMPPRTPYEEGEQVVIAIHACVPPWIRLSPRDVPQNGPAILAVSTTPSTFDLEREEIACVLAAGSDCGEVRGCFGIEIFADERCTGPSIGCEGSAVSTCVLPDPVTGRMASRARQDCRHEGLTCSAAVGGLCVSASCTPPTLTCEGDALVGSCGGGTVRIECDPGMACVDGACRGTGGACTRNECVDGAFVICDTAHHTVVTRVRCDDYGARCVSDGLGASCAPRDTQCNASSPTVCLDTELRYCGVGGSFVSYDCVAHGFGPCEIDPSTSDMRCGPPGRRLF